MPLLGLGRGAFRHVHACASGRYLGVFWRECRVRKSASGSHRYKLAKPTKRVDKMSTLIVFAILNFNAPFVFKPHGVIIGL